MQIFFPPKVVEIQ